MEVPVEAGDHKNIQVLPTSPMDILSVAKTHAFGVSEFAKESTFKRKFISVIIRANALFSISLTYIL